MPAEATVAGSTPPDMSELQIHLSGVRVKQQHETKLISRCLPPSRRKRIIGMQPCLPTLVPPRDIGEDKTWYGAVRCVQDIESFQPPIGFSDSESSADN